MHHNGVEPQTPKYPITKDDAHLFHEYQESKDNPTRFEALDRQIDQDLRESALARVQEHSGSPSDEEHVELFDNQENINPDSDDEFHSPNQ